MKPLWHSSILIISVVFVGLSGKLIPQEPAEVELPFATEEVTGRHVVTLRHKMTYNVEEKQLSWERLEAELSDDARLSVFPDTISLKEGEPKSFRVLLTVKDGRVEAQPTVVDSDWRTPIQVRLEPRDVRWNDPLVMGDGIAIAGSIVMDTRLDSKPMRWISEIDIESVSIDRLETGTYELSNFAGEGSWDRPNWEIERASVEIFGGLITLSGEGRWGTNEEPRVSLLVQGHGVALQPLLRAFNAPRADQVQARIGGAMKLEAVGRDWNVLNMQIYSEEGTVFLDRRLIYDLLAPAFAEVLTKEQVDEALNNAFGDAQMIPFDQMSLGGALSPDQLVMELPLRNEALNLDIEPRVDRELVWDAYDFLRKMGLENIKSRSFGLENEATVEPQ